MVPPALKNRPRLEEVDLWYFTAYTELSRCRPGGDTLAPIPLSEALAYFEIYGISSPTERDALLKRVRRMDNAYLKYTAEQRKQEMERAKNTRK